MEIKWRPNKTKGTLVVQTMVFPDNYWPVIVFGGCEDNVFRRSWWTSLSTKIIPQGIWTFIGLDRGNIVEADIEVYTQEDIPLVLRSLHKETLGNYDAWQYNSIDYVGATQVVKVAVTCRVNGKNLTLPRQLQARFHVGVVLIGETLEIV
jgi:hypothetical protein